MIREKGKVPTKINKEMVAGGEVKNHTQIKSEGSKSITQKDVLKLLRENRTASNKSQKLDIEAIKKEGIEVSQNRKIQKPVEFTKRIIGHDKDR